MAQPQDPVHEEIQPILAEGQSQPEVWVLPQGGGPPEHRQVEVCRRENNPDKVYQLIDGFEPKPLSHGGPLWGYLFLGFVLHRRPIDGFYEEPTEATVRRVVIKRLLKAVVDADLRRGSRENPYKEIMRMQQLAGGPTGGFVEDAYANDHVLGCVDALVVGEKFLYIIAPYCERESLMQHVPIKPTDNESVEAQARSIYRQMLEALQDLHENHHICHRDVDPGNFLMRGDGRILLNDLAMSFKFHPPGLVDYIGAIGKPPYCPPETLQRGMPFWARQCDLWASTITLFNLVTGYRLYKWPVPSDIIFRYAIMAQGLSPQFINPMVERVLAETDPTEFLLVSQISQRILSLSPQLMKLFHGVLTMNPNHRWNMDDVWNCEWMNMNLP